jgi:lipoprotein-releasing system permease protein
MYIWSVATRYLRARSITWVATLLIAINVLMYLLIISVLEGFKAHYMDKLQSVLAHTTVGVGNLADGIEKPEAWAAELQKLDPGIKGITYGIEAPAMVIFNNAQTVGTLRGIDLGRELATSRLKEMLEPKELRETLKEFGAHEHGGKPLPGCIVGGLWRRNYNLKVGDRVTFAFSSEEDEFGDSNPRSNAFSIVGFYESKNPYLENGAYVDRTFLAGRLNVQGKAKTLFMWLNNPDREDLKQLREKIDARTKELVQKEDDTRPKSYKRAHLVDVQTWQQQDNNFYEAISRENLIMRFIMAVFLALIAFIIFLIFGRLVAEKVRDIGALRAMGATPAGINGCFLAQGLMIGGIGLICGLIVSYFFINNVNAIANFIHFDPFPNAAFGVDKIPTRTLPQDILVISLLTLAFAILGALWPAWRASRLNPVECLRHE